MVNLKRLHAIDYACSDYEASLKKTLIMFEETANCVLLDVFIRPWSNKTCAHVQTEYGNYLQESTFCERFYSSVSISKRNWKERGKTKTHGIVTGGKKKKLNVPPSLQFSRCRRDRSWTRQPGAAAGPSSSARTFLAPLHAVRYSISLFYSHRLSTIFLNLRTVAIRHRLLCPIT